MLESTKDEIGYDQVDPEEIIIKLKEIHTYLNKIKRLNEGK